MRMVYMAHAFSGQRARNLESAKEWLRWFLEHSPKTAIVAPWIAHAEAVQGTALDREDLALAICFETISRCREIWLCGPFMSGGMIREAFQARESGISVRSFLSWGPSPPSALGEKWHESFVWPSCEHSASGLTHDNSRLEHQLRETHRALADARRELERRPPRYEFKSGRDECEGFTEFEGESSPATCGYHKHGPDGRVGATQIEGLA